MRDLKIFLLVFIFSITISAQWGWQNPKPQGNDLLDIQSITNDIGFACGRYGTVLKTTTGGEEWFVLSFPKRIDLLRLCFINPTIGWVTGQKDSVVYLYKTMNSGNTWTKQLEIEAELISSFFIDEFKGWLGIDSTLFRTTDGGDTWTQLLTVGPITDILFFDTMHGWVASKQWSPSSYNSKIYSTTNGGNSWQNSVIEIPIVSKITFENVSKGWIITIDNLGPNTSGSSVWNTTDGGITWQQQLEISGWGYYYIFTDLVFINQYIGWTVTAEGTIYKTIDSGTNWIELSNVDLFNQITSINEQLLWGCGSFGVNYISTDGGATWLKNYVGEIINDTWELFVLNDDLCFVGGERALLKTSNGGNEWDKIELNVSGHTYLNARAIWFNDTLHGWLGLEYLGAHGGLLRTVDGGNTWTNQVDSIHRIFEISFFNDSLGWFGSGHKIYHTSDGGNTWFVQAEQPEISEFLAIQFTSINTGWAGGFMGLFKTTDGGYNWIQVFPSGINLKIIGIHFINPLVGWIIGDGGYEDKILKTTDAGLTWVDQSNQISLQSINAIYFTDFNNGWVVGMNEFSGAVIHSTNGGSDWEAVDFPTSTTLSNICFANENIGWALGSYGLILQTTNGGVSFIDNEKTKPTEYILEQNYPNPFNPSTKISYNLKAEGNVKLIIYDIKGELITNLVNEKQQPGSYEVDFTLPGNISTGVYFYRLIVSDNNIHNVIFSDVKKMVYLK